MVEEFLGLSDWHALIGKCTGLSDFLSKVRSFCVSVPMKTIPQHPDSFALLAKSHLPVLLLGETGVGKEVFARRLHRLSARQHKSFVAVNCGALSSSLLESTLFGACKGAFTGAIRDTPGLIRSAHQGTLFLDEIGELPMDSQSRLLRVLQEKAVLPLGSDREISVDFRLVCATHRHLPSLVRQGLFRADLFYRMSVLPWTIPPLRDRRNEILPIACDIWREMEPSGELRDYVEPHELRLLEEYAWPGNIRELRHVLERFSLFRNIGSRLGDCIYSSVSEFAEPYRVPSAQSDSERIRMEMERTGGNQTKAAQNLGISRGALQYQLKKLESQSQSKLVVST